MSKRILLFVAAGALLAAGVAYAQFPVMDMVADKVIQKYQSSTCEQLWQEKAQGQGQPKPEMEQRAIQMLKQDPQMRQAFFNKIVGADRQQDVRMRNDPVTTTRRRIMANASCWSGWRGWALALTVGCW